MATDIVFILDRSGSMSSLVDDVIGGFNSFISEQKQLKDKAYLTTVIFDTEYDVIMDRIKIEDVPVLTRKEYNARGGTALLDAIGRTIEHFKATKKSKNKILVFINTDGQENSSIEFTKSQIKDLVEKSRKDGWEFVFIGANMDSIHEASSIGITFSGNYSNTPLGQASVYTTISNMTRGYRNSDGQTLDTSQLDNLK